MVNVVPASLPAEADDEAAEYQMVVSPRDISIRDSHYDNDSECDPSPDNGVQNDESPDDVVGQGRSERYSPIDKEDVPKGSEDQTSDTKSSHFMSGLIELREPAVVSSNFPSTEPSPMRQAVHSTPVPVTEDRSGMIAKGPTTATVGGNPISRTTVPLTFLLLPSESPPDDFRNLSSNDDQDRDLDAATEASADKADRIRSRHSPSEQYDEIASSILDLDMLLESPSQSDASSSRSQSSQHDMNASNTIPDTATSASPNGVDGGLPLFPTPPSIIHHTSAQPPLNYSLPVSTPGDVADTIKMTPHPPALPLTPSSPASAPRGSLETPSVTSTASTTPNDHLLSPHQSAISDNDHTVQNAGESRTTSPSLPDDTGFEGVDSPARQGPLLNETAGGSSVSRISNGTICLFSRSTPALVALYPSRG